MAASELGVLSRLAKMRILNGEMHFAICDNAFWEYLQYRVLRNCIWANKYNFALCEIVFRASTYNFALCEIISRARTRSCAAYDIHIPNLAKSAQPEGAAGVRPLVKNGRIFTLCEMHFGRVNAVSHYEELCFGLVNTISHYAKLYFGAGALTHVHVSRNAFRGRNAISLCESVSHADTYNVAFFLTPLSR